MGAFETELETGGLDVIVGNWPVPTPRLMHVPLASAELACLVAADHPTPADTPLTLEDYLKLGHISPSAQQDWSISPIDGMLARLGVERRVMITVPDDSIPLITEHSSY